MHLPPLQPPTMAGFYVSGDVTIAPDVVIAPGVVLLADPSSSIVIAGGVCIGLGAVIHAYGGAIAIEAGVNLGAGVLLVGQCRIGTTACIGASATLYNAVVAPGQLVPSGSLLGAPVGSTATVRPISPYTSPPSVSQAQSHPQESKVNPSSYPSPWDDGNGDSSSLGSNPPSPSPSTEPDTHPKPPKVVYGKEQFYQMRMMMFPDDRS